MNLHFYSTIPEGSDGSPIDDPLYRLMDFLSYNGFRVTAKPVREITDGDIKRRGVGNVHMNMAVDMMTAAPHLDHIVYFGSYKDQALSLEAAQKQGCRVSVVGTSNGGYSQVSDALRKMADNFIEFADLAPSICNDNFRTNPPSSSKPKVREYS